MKRLSILATAALAAFALAGPASAQSWSLFGGATQQNGTIQLVSDVSDATTTNDFSGINFTNLGNVTLADLKVLSAEYNVTDDDCGGGSPRFQLNVDGKNVFVYFGPTPNFTGCAQNTWLSTGNLIGSTDARFDLSQLGGPMNATYQQAIAFFQTYTGSKTITGIQLVVDSGWFFADKEQTVLVRNVIVNTKIAGGTIRSGLNPAQYCKAQRQLMGDAAFAALYGTNANKRNAHGKCVSQMANAKQAGTLVVTQTVILNAAKSCKAQNVKGRALGTCVSRQVATLQKQNATVAAQKAKGKAKGKGKK